MSADNGIYIIQTSQGFRAAHAFSPEIEEETQTFDEIFGQSPVFGTLVEAWDYAKYLEQEHDGTEYGIRILGISNVPAPLLP